MMPVVRISDQTWMRLQQYAQPLVDTPDSVINAALDILDLSRGTKKTLPTQASRKPNRKRNELTPQKDFRLPLIKILLELGGSASVSDIRNRMEQKLKSKLKPGDMDQVSSGDPRWWNAICWERANLVREGLFRKDSPRGTWQLSDRGKAQAKRSTIKWI